MRDGLACLLSHIPACYGLRVLFDIRISIVMWKNTKFGNSPKPGALGELLKRWLHHPALSNDNRLGSCSLLRDKPGLARILGKRSTPGAKHNFLAVGILTREVLGLAYGIVMEKGIVD